MSSLCEWDRISVKSWPRYLKIRRVLKSELDDNLVTMGNSEVRSDYWDFFNLSFPRSPEVSENFKTQLSLALNTLTPKEQCVLSMRFGVGEYVKSHLLREIGEVIGASIERIRQIEQKALRKLRHPYRRKLIEGFETDY